MLTYAENPEEGLPQEGEFCECMFYDKSYDRYFFINAGSRRIGR